jgi:hypothetical protein
MDILRPPLGIPSEWWGQGCYSNHVAEFAAVYAELWFVGELFDLTLRR